MRKVLSHFFWKIFQMSLKVQWKGKKYNNYGNSSILGDMSLHINIHERQSSDRDRQTEKEKMEGWQQEAIIKSYTPYIGFTHTFTPTFASTHTHTHIEMQSISHFPYTICPYTHIKLHTTYTSTPTVDKRFVCFHNCCELADFTKLVNKYSVKSTQTYYRTCTKKPHHLPSSTGNCKNESMSPTPLNITINQLAL